MLKDHMSILQVSNTDLQNEDETFFKIIAKDTLHAAIGGIMRMHHKMKGAIKISQMNSSLLHKNEMK